MLNLHSWLTLPWGVVPTDTAMLTLRPEHLQNGAYIAPIWFTANLHVVRKNFLAKLNRPIRIFALWSDWLLQDTHCSIWLKEQSGKIYTLCYVGTEGVGPDTD